MIAVFVLLTSFSILAQSPDRYITPQQLDDGWAVDHIANHSIDTSLVNRFFASLPGNKGHNIHSILLVKNDTLLIEAYFDKYAPQKTHDMRSATKSIASLLLGIAIDKGFVKSIHEPVLNYFEDYRPLKYEDDRHEQITIRHLLTMSSGMECNDWDKKSPGQEDKMYKKKDWFRFLLDLPMAHQPGDTALYCTGGVVLLGEIITRASGKNLDDFAEEYLFKPLGIYNYRWSYIKKSRKVDAGGHIYMTPRDLAKIGQLVLNKGRWNGNQIVSSEWVTSATTTHTRIGNMDYGYLWWQIPFKYPDREIPSICASGNGGQFIIIVPEFNLVAAFTGGNYNSDKAQAAFHLMYQIFLPAQHEFLSAKNK